MRFTLNLLAVVLAVFLAQVDAAPTRRNTGMVTLPIRSLHGLDRRDLHSQLYLQQHINRAERRLARMTGRTGPTDDALRARLNKRMYIIGNSAVTPGRRPGGAPLSKRYNQPSKMLEAFREKMSKSKTASSLAVGLPAALNSTAANTTDVNATAANATAGAGQGVSPLDIQAAETGDLVKANAPTGDNSLGLDIEGPDVGYIAQVQLGTPPRSFAILMDSGSADFWVGSENCKSQAGGDCGNHQFLGTQSSSSFKDNGTAFTVTYGTGEVQGKLAQDNLELAGLKLTAHTFGTADIESVEFSDDQTKFDGLMGLAQSGLSQQKTATPVEALTAQGLIKDAITSYKISRLADQKNDGEITFGGLDTTKFDQASLVTLPNINTDGFWEADMDGVAVDGQDAGLKGRTAIIDTGTTLIIAPPDDAAAVHKLIKGAKSDGQGGFIVPCTTTQAVALTFGGKSFTIDPRDIAPLPVDPADPTGDCTSGIAAGSVGGAEEWLVGDVFLKNAYFSTDVGKNSLSLAKLV